MSVPKSVTKIKKNGVEYISEVDKCNYLMFELCRGALRDVGKFVSKSFRDEYYKHFKKHTGNAGRATKYKVFSSKNTIYPRVEIGLTNQKADGFYAYFQEFGTKSGNVPKLGIMQGIVKNNVDKIIEIESKYLSALEDEAAALAKINEAEMEGDADD